MEVIKYNSVNEITDVFNNLYFGQDVKNSGLYDWGVSVSFRTYDKVGNTIELHVYYRK